MASILDFLNTTKGEKFISKVSEQTSEEKNNVTSVLGIAFPILLGALRKNLSLPEGEEKLISELSSEKYNLDFIDSLDKITPSKFAEDGNNILDHILNSNRDSVISTIGKTVEMKESSVSDIFKMAALLLINILSSQMIKNKIDSANLNTLLASLLGASSAYDNSLIKIFLSGNKEGNIIDDISGIILGGGNNGKKGGSILGGMTGGK